MLDAGPHEPGLVREDHRLDAVAQVELRENVRDVGLDRVLADDELGGDLGVRTTACGVEYALVDDVNEIERRFRVT
jgi:hypothetical protein